MIGKVQVREGRPEHYDIVYHDSESAFLMLMNQAINEGWEPVGDLIVTPDPKTGGHGMVPLQFHYHQAIRRVKQV